MAGQDVCSSLLLLHLYLLLLLLLSADSRQQEDSPEEECPCERRRMSTLMNVPFPHDTIRATRSGKLNCCVAKFLGYHDPQASVLWRFKGKTYPWPWEVNTFREHYCGMETLETRGASVSDEGLYTCTVTSSNGTVVSMTMALSIDPNADFREKPRELKMSGQVYALAGHSTSFSCKAYVGMSSDIAPRVTWIKVTPSGAVYKFATRLPNVNTSQVIKGGEITGHLMFLKVEKAHFGTYVCMVQNVYGRTRGNFSLVDGVPEPERLKENIKMIVVVVVVLLVLLLLGLYVWCRCGLLLRLYCSHNIVGASVKEGFHQDVFLVHGDSASSWVWSVLLPMLEDTCGYTCFLPQRDMCGGDQVAESILGAISRCRRVLVVVTPCLLDSPWASWAMCSGIHAVLTSRAHMLALVLKEETMHVNSPQAEALLGILKVVKQIPVPTACGLRLVEGQGDHMIVSAAVRLEKETQPPEMKLTIPEIKIDTTWSNSPKSQRLSNMISASNTASRENLEADDDKKTEAEGPVIFTEEFGFQDPGSPCSITPFIMPSCRKNRGAFNQASVWESLSRCMYLVFVRDIQQVFWQTVRYRLGPPSLRNQERKPTPKA